MTRVIALATVLLIAAAPARAQQLAPSLATPNVLGRAVAEAFENQNATPPAQPEHTGLSALAHETWNDFKAFPRRKSTWAILGASGALALAVHPADKPIAEHYAESGGGAAWFWAPGKYVGGVGMVVAPITIYVIGRYVIDPAPDGSHTNNWSHLGFDLVRAQIVNEVLVQAIKFSVQRERPNGSKRSFPSGHAAASFAFASVLERHLGYRFAWPTVAAATYVAASRLHDNVHYLSDVVFGAGLGTAVGWTVVGRHGRNNYALVPSIGPNAVSFNLVRSSASNSAGSRR